MIIPKEDKITGTQDYLIKISESAESFLKNIENPSILEFGVRHGYSTRYFLNICEKKNGYLYSVDIDDCSKVSNSSHWKFIQSRDDNFEYIEKLIPQKFDLIFIDSFHNAQHVKKIFYHYVNFLKKGGILLIDDINWLIYTKDKVKDNFNSEINNYETFVMLLEILNNNNENIDIKFNFRGSGMAVIKKNNDTINFTKKIISRKFSFKNFLRKILLK